MTGAALALAGLSGDGAATTGQDLEVAPSKAALLADVLVPMRDGVELAADVYLPSSDGVVPHAGKYPVLLMRTPYDKKIWAHVGGAVPFASAGGLTPEVAVAHGYAVVFQDVRGTHASEGSFESMQNEGPDGADTVAWLRRQPWSDGRVATFGPSYMGGAQMLLAAENPAGLVAAFPQVAATDQFGQEWIYRDGVFAMTAVAWTLHVAAGQASRLSPEAQTLFRSDASALGASAAGIPNEAVAKIYGALPLTEAPLVRAMPWWTHWLANRDNPAYFERNAMSGRFNKIEVPMLHLGGWYDLFLRNSYTHYKAIAKEGRGSRARRNQRLVIGPWSHTSCDGCDANSFVSAADMQVAWMDQWFKGKMHPFFRHPVSIYVMGANRWRAESDWPLQGTVRTRYFLESGGNANGADGDGRLSLQAPAGGMSDRYRYDPHNPAPTLGGVGLSGSRALQTVAEGRPDMLVYTTPPLEHDTEVTGEISATLYAASSATDTDWWVKLIDVAPDGRAYILTEGVVRARYRYSRTDPEPLVPGRIEKYRFDMWATSNMFLKGHRIRIAVTSSNFPYADRNPNIFVDLASVTEKDFRVASQTVYHGGEHPSYVELPIIPQSRRRDWIATPFPLRR